MGLISGSVSSLVNGVSQQPPWLRLPSQGAVQENLMSSLVDGLIRRPPTEHVARLSATPISTTAAHLHTINRRDAEKYSVLLTNGDLKVYDLADGTEKTVAFPSGKAYLSATTPKTSFTCTTIADFTFVTNREKVVTETNAGYTANSSIYVYVKQAFYNCNYQVYIDGVVQAQHLTAASGGQPQTEVIAAALLTTLRTNLSHPTIWTVDQQGSVLIIRKNDGTTHQIRTYDSQGDAGIVSWGSSIQNFVDLPRVAPDGTVVEVTGSSSNAFDSYYVIYNATKAQWEETFKPADRARPTPSTMPWKLTRETDGTFTFAEIDWKWRAAGDAESNPSPSFIGNTINDVLIFRNRLFLLSDQNAVGSRAGGENFFDFYAATATTTLDSDPVDVAINSNTSAVPLARYGIPFGDDLMIFTDPGQFRLGSADQAFTPTTARVSPAAEYAVRLTAKPATNGQLVHFAIEKGGDSGIREGLIDASTETFKAADVTIHVPTYLTGEVTTLLSLSNRDTLLVTTAGSSNTIAVYTWYIENNEKLQSSWSKWVFPSGDSILNLSYIDGDLFIVVSRSTGVFLEKVQLDSSYVDSGLSYNVRLDRKKAVTGTYDAGNNWTTWTLPYDLTGIEPVGVFGSAFTGKAGFQMSNLVVVNAAAGTVRVVGYDLSAGPCHFGVRFTSRYQLSRVSVPASTGNGGKGQGAMTDGRLQLRTVFFNHSMSGHYTVTVSYPARSDYVYTYSPNAIGGTSLIGTVQLNTGRFRVPVRGKSDLLTVDLTSDSQYPCSILSFDWEGEFTLRSRKV